MKTPTMSPEQIKIAIAEACNWKGVYVHDGQVIGQEAGEGMFTPVPDYLNDLNAIHKAEEFLTHDIQRTRFLQHLIPEQDLSPENDATNGNVWTICHSTASQRCDAFVRTIGKWKVGE